MSGFDGDLDGAEFASSSSESIDESPINYADAPSEEGAPDTANNAGADAQTVEGSMSGTASHVAQNAASAVTGALSVPVTAVSNAAHAVTGAIGKTFNLSPVVSKVVAAMLAVVLVATGGYTALSFMNDDDLQTVYVGLNCKKIIDDAKNKSGYGERMIPEKIGPYWLGRMNTVEFTIEVGLDGSKDGKWKGWRGNGTPQSKINEWAEANGGEDSRGFSMVGDYYLTAVQPAMWGKVEGEKANVGDWVTVYMENGESFEMIISDTKGNAEDNVDIDTGQHVNYLDPANAERVIRVDTPTGPATITSWGHVLGDDVDIIEFWGETSKINGKAYSRMGYPNMRPVSFTNHGMAPELVGVIDGGALGVAEKNHSNARGRYFSMGINECKGRCEDSSPDYDNSTLVKAALSLSYSQSKELHEGYPGTKLYTKVYEAVQNGDGCVAGGRSCDHVIGTIVRWSGIDDGYPMRACSNQLAHVASSDRWKDIPYTAGDFSNLEPGDIWISGNHTSMYVGNEAIVSFEFKDDANIGPVPAGAFSVSGSIGSETDMGGPASRAACVGLDASVQTNVAWRCVNPQTPGTSKFADESLAAGSISSQMGCEDEKKDNSTGANLARVAASLSYSRTAFASSGYLGTAAYNAAGDKIGARKPYRSCDRGASIPIRLTGLDPDFPWGLRDHDPVVHAHNNQQDYLGWDIGISRSDKWQCVGAYNDGDENSGLLQPGDIVVSDDHICMYIGYDIAQEVYRTRLVGTDADIGQPGPDMVWVSAHRGRSINGDTRDTVYGDHHTGTAPLSICPRKYASPGGGGAKVFRYIGPNTVPQSLL